MNIKLKLTTLLLTVFSATNFNNHEYSGASAFNAQSIIYDASKDTTDYAFISIPFPDGKGKYAGHDSRIYSRHMLVLGFDAPNVEKIHRIGFRVTYKEQSWWDEIRNGFRLQTGREPIHGTIKSNSFLISSNTEYSFKRLENDTYTGGVQMGVKDLKNTGTYADESKLKFNAIGKVSDLLVAEDMARNILPKENTSYWIDKNNEFINSIITGGYHLRKLPNHRINDQSKSLTKREFFTIIPVELPKDVAPESISCTLLDGTEISDGLDDNGNAYTETDPVTQVERKYIDTTVSKDFGVAINGIKAKLTGINVTGYTAGNDSEIILVNGSWDYEKKDISSVTNTMLISENIKKDFIWDISNNNRYIFIQWDGNIEYADDIKIRLYYDTEEGSVAWLINVTDKDGNFLPKPIETDPNVIPVFRLEHLIIIFAIALAVFIALALIWDLFKTAIFR